MEKLTIQDIQELLKTPQKILITTHKSPDGDAIGSSLGLAGVLKQLGHSVNVVVPDAYPKFLAWMEGIEMIHVFEDDAKAANELASEAHVIFCLDYNTFGRIGDYAPAIEKANAIKLLIDHHQQPDDFPNYLKSDTLASSTCELVYDFIEEIEAQQYINKGIAECLYSGIVTDTGSFRFSSTSPKTMRIAAGLMEKGVEVDQLYIKLFDNNRLDRLRLMGYTLSEKLKLKKEFNTAYISLSVDELDRFNFERGDTEGLVNYGLSIEGVKFAAFFRESKDSDYIRISFRSKGTFNVNEFARAHFNGGGHINAAGGRSDLSLQDTIIKFEALLEDYEAALND